MSQALNIEKANLDKFLNSFLSVDEAINDNLELLDIAVEESDENSIHEINEETKVLITSVEDLEFNRMFSQIDTLQQIFCSLPFAAKKQ